MCRTACRVYHHRLGRTDRAPWAEARDTETCGPCAGRRGCPAKPVVVSVASASEEVGPTDSAAVDTLEVLRRRGPSAPADCSVTANDGFGPPATPHLGLTTFRRPVEEIGRASIDLPLDRIEAGRTRTGCRIRPARGRLPTAQRRPRGPFHGPAVVDITVRRGFVCPGAAFGTPAGRRSSEAAASGPPVDAAGGRRTERARGFLARTAVP